MQPASTAGALARGLGLDPSAAPVEVLLNPLKTAVGSIGGTAAWESASATAGTRARSPHRHGARPPCSGPSSGPQNARRRSDAKASLRRRRPIAYPA